jgi:membrane protease YdiL (CAAX protease family)
MTQGRWAAVCFALVCLLYLAFRMTGEWAEAQEGVVKVLLWAVPCVAVIRLHQRVGYRAVLEQLGLGGGVARGYFFGLVATLPMLLVLQVAGPLRVDIAAIVGTVWLGPFAEEVLFRGFLFRQLHRCSGWHARTAMLASGLAFGFAHFGNVRLDSAGSLLLAVGEVGMTAAGGVLFAWIVFRWDSLWPAVGLHSFMNLSWEIFGADQWASQTQAGATAIGSTLANAARLASIGLAIYLTLRWRPRQQPSTELEIG